ncbi:MAG: hypothetical protein R2867_32445 [Caldilineaceae bacterium]
MVGYLARAARAGDLPQPLQNPLPIWLGVGARLASFVRGLLKVTADGCRHIGGETERFRPAIDLYRQLVLKQDIRRSSCRCGLHSLGYVANSRKEAIADYYPGYAETFTRIGKERGGHRQVGPAFDAQKMGQLGALLACGPEESHRRSGLLM